MTCFPHWVVLAAGVTAFLSPPPSLSFHPSCIFECFHPLLKYVFSKMWLTDIFRYRYWLFFAKETQQARTGKHQNNAKGYVYSSATVLITTSAPLIWGWLGSSLLLLICRYFPYSEISSVLYPINKKVPMGGLMIMLCVSEQFKIWYLYSMGNGLWETWMVRTGTLSIP